MLSRFDVGSHLEHEGAGVLARHPEVFLGLDIADTVRAAAGSIARRLEVGEVDPRCASPGHSKSDLECDHPTTQKAPFYADFEFRGTLSARMSPVSASCARLGKQNRFGVPVFIAPSVTLSPRLMTSTATSPLDRCRAHLPRAGWVSTFLLEWLRKQCDHPAQVLTARRCTWAWRSGTPAESMGPDGWRRTVSEGQGEVVKGQ